MRPLLALLLVVWVPLPPSVAAADPLPLERTIRVGRPPVPVRLALVADGDGVRVSARGAGAAAEVELPAPGATEASVEVVTLAGGARVGVARVVGPGSSAAAIVAAHRGRASILWSGRLDLRGDPGERRASVLEISDRTDDGVPDVVVGTRREDTAICGQDATLLDPHAVDPATLTLRPVVLRRLPEGADEVEITATTQSPRPSGAPMLDALHFVSASTTAGVSDPLLRSPPTALVDGDPATAWTEGHGGDGRWEFATARWEGGSFRIRAVALTPAPADPELAARLGRPRTLWLVGSEGPRLRVTLPEDPRPGVRYWVVPPEPVRWRCLSLVLDSAFHPDGTAPDHVRTAIAEVAAYTDLDFGDGVAELVDELVADADAGADAARLLITLGPAGIAAVREAWERLSPLGRMRGVRVLAPAAASDAAAREGLAEGARDADEGVRAASLEALLSAGAPGHEQLADLAARADEAGDAAAIAFARTPDAVPFLLEALARDGGSERPGLRRALREAVRASGRMDGVRAWAATGPAPSPAASAALALSRTGTASDVATQLVQGALGAERFEDRWRLVTAAATLPAQPTIDRWLSTTATSAQEWMLRAAAVEALGSRGSPLARAAASEALDDEYPRVRVAGLTAARGPLERVATLARRDDWPMVRAAAVEALRGERRALPVVRAAVADDAQSVRAAAVRALAAARDRQSVPLVVERLEDDEEWPAVVSASLAFVRELCVPEAATALRAVVARGSRANAWAPDVDAAVAAIEVAGHLPGEEAAGIVERAARPGIPVHFQQAAARARERGRPCR